MQRDPTITIGLICSALFAWPAFGQPRSAGAIDASPSSAVAQQGVLQKYCVSCHNQRTKTAGLAIDALLGAPVAGHAESWEKVVRKLRAGMMPPAGRPRPDAPTVASLRGWIEGELDRAAAASPNPGRTEAFHRLNRVEYTNAIRDLLALDVDATTLLPADDTSYGFDNIAGVLKVNQTSMERYVTAARKVSRLAVASAPVPPGSETFSVSPQLSQYERIEGLPFGTRGGTLVKHNFPRSGEYDISIVLMCVNTRGGDENCADGSTGFPEDHQMIVLLDGAVVKSFDFESEPRHDRYAGNTGTVDGTSTFAETQRLQVRLAIPSGPHELGVTFVKLPSVETVQRTFRQTFSKPQSYRGVDRAMQITVPFVSKVVVTGPFEERGVADTPSRRRIFVCRPANAAEEPACARTILSTLARRAFRGPVTQEDLEPLLRVYTATRADGEGFDAGIEDGLRALLVRPRFWYRVEKDPAGVPPGGTYPIDDVALASRLSFFLWSSIPDDELLRLAETGRLHEPTVLKQQVRRMVADPKSRALTTSFAAQWLELRRVATVTPNESDFPNFEEGLRMAMETESELFVDSIIRENRSALDMISADYTFLNGRLAQHYGIDNVQGSHFRRVQLPANNPHRGILGQGAVMLVTSHPTRTSPVKRGKWILDNILGSPPPPPPPNVPALKEKQNLEQVGTVRERMAQHRSDPYCAGCHASIDPLGFLFENFDPVGRYRTVDERYQPVDATGALPDGTKLNGIGDLRALLLKRPDGFMTTMTEKLLTYALGRGVEYYDMPAVRAIVREAAATQYRMGTIIEGVVNSVPFRMRRAAVPEALTAGQQQ